MLSIDIRINNKIRGIKIRETEIMVLQYADNTIGVLNPFTPVGAHRAILDFTLSNARRFHSLMGNPLGVNGLRMIARWRVDGRKAIFVDLNGLNIQSNA